MSEACFHCGEEITGKPIFFDNKDFCCNGCSMVYSLLKENDLDTFYSLESAPGVKPKTANPHKYAFLDVEKIQEKYIQFEDDKSSHVTLFLPQIHCSSCIYLLENLARIHPGVISCQVQFSRRKAVIAFEKDKLEFSELALLLDKIGYPPKFGDEKEIRKKLNTRFLYKLGLAGFAFGSIMLWTVPEYLGIEEDSPEFRFLPSLLSFIVSVPVLLFSASEYLISAWKAIRARSLNLDVPISIGIIALYSQSCYHIFTNNGPGYMDSFAGFVFFLLIGKWFQNKTYESLAFDRDYKSYFPIAVTRISENNEEIIELHEIKKGDQLLLRNEEIIPCDCFLLSDSTKIDYSFVTGESEPIVKQKGDFIYAGGKILGNKVSIQVENETDRSHITQLWNDSSEKKDQKSQNSDKVSLYFIIGLIIIAFFASIYWMWLDSSRTLQIVVSILIVACPCALALSAPFTYGSIMRQLGRKGLYLKNVEVIRRMNDVDTIVLDKTGTLTHGNFNEVSFVGEEFTAEEMKAIALTCSNSTHPLSRGITRYLRSYLTGHDEGIKDFKESKGQGISGTHNEFNIALGSAAFVSIQSNEQNETEVHLAINGNYKGKFVFTSSFRERIWELLTDLEKKYSIHILSGDSEKDKERILKEVPGLTNIVFNQTPQDKLHYIEKLEDEGHHVMMIGDGLNDTGALSKANVGIAVSEDMFNFTPNSDAIIGGDHLKSLNRMLVISNHSKTVLIVCYIFSILYNFIGLSFAISGNLTPLIAAILMPISSISIVIISTLLSRLKH